MHLSGIYYIITALDEESANPGQIQAHHLFSRGLRAKGWFLGL